MLKKIIMSQCHIDRPASELIKLYFSLLFTWTLLEIVLSS